MEPLEQILHGFDSLDSTFPLKPDATVSLVNVFGVVKIRSEMLSLASVVLLWERASNMCVSTRKHVRYSIISVL